MYVIMRQLEPIESTAKIILSENFPCTRFSLALSLIHFHTIATKRRRRQRHWRWWWQWVVTTNANCIVFICVRSKTEKHEDFSSSIGKFFYAAWREINVSVSSSSSSSYIKSSKYSSIASKNLYKDSFVMLDGIFLSELRSALGVPQTIFHNEYNQNQTHTHAGLSLFIYIYIF